MIIEFNKNLELIFGLLYCVNKDLNLKLDFVYENDSKYCEEFYKLYKNNITKDFIYYIKNGGLDSYNRTAFIALSLNDNYEFYEDIDLSFIERRNKYFKKKQLEQFLKEFVNKSNFDEFFYNNKDKYNKLISLYKDNLNKYNDFNENVITCFYGFKIKDFKIYLFNFSAGSYGLETNKNIVYLNGIRNRSNDKKTFNFSPYILNTLFHEFSHPYINPLTFKYFKNIELNNLLSDAKNNNLEPWYNNTNTLVNEYLVRSVQVILSRRYYDSNYINKNILSHKKIGFTYLEDLIDVFKNKNKYSSFEEFYKNEIIPFFIELDSKLK